MNIKLSENRKRIIVKMFKRGFTMSKIGVLFELGTLDVEKIIRDWMVEQDKILNTPGRKLFS